MSLRNTNTIGYRELALRKNLEKEIGDAIENGILLGEIRDAELYREDGYETFEEYCTKRWGLDPAQVETQINGARELKGGSIRKHSIQECARMLGVPDPLGRDEEGEEEAA